MMTPTISCPYAPLTTENNEPNSQGYFFKYSNATKPAPSAKTKAPATSQADGNGAADSTSLAPKITRVQSRHANPWESPSKNVVVLDNTRWNVFVTVAKESEEAGDYEEAERFWIAALDTAREFSIKDPRVLYTIGGLANILFKAGEIERCKPFFFAHTKLTVQVFGENHIKTAESLARLGMVYYSLESLPAAKLCYVHALDIHISSSGVISKEVLQAHQSLAMVLQAQGDFDGALQCLRKAIAVSARLYGQQAPQTATLHFQLRTLVVNASQVVV